MKKYTLITLFLAFTLFGCDTPEAVEPAIGNTEVRSNATETPFYFQIKLVNSKGIRFLFRHEETSTVQYSLRYRIAFADNTFHILGTQLYKATAKNNGTIWTAPIPAWVNRSKPHSYRVEVTRGGQYVGDFEVK